MLLVEGAEPHAPSLCSYPDSDATAAQLVTASVYAAMKREIRARQDGGWARVEWALPTRPQLRDLEVVHGRMLYLNPKVPHPLCRLGSQTYNVAMQFLQRHQSRQQLTVARSRELDRLKSELIVGMRGGGVRC